MRKRNFVNVKNKLLPLLFIFVFLKTTYAVDEDNRRLTLTTLIKTEYWQWDEYSFNYLSQNNKLLTERGPVFGLQLLSEIHSKKRMQGCLKIGFMYGSPKYESQNYNKNYDTTFLINSVTQYAGFESNLRIGFDLLRKSGSRIKAVVTPVLGLEYKYWKRTIPWKNVYLNETQHIRYYGYYEHWHNLLGIGGIKATMLLFDKIDFTLDLLAGYPALVLERTDLSDASRSEYNFDLEPELLGTIEGKASVGYKGFYISITGKHMPYARSEPVLVEMPKAENRFQPRSVLTAIGIALQYTTDLWHLNKN